MTGSVIDPAASPLALYGSELRRLREEKGITQEQLADFCHVSKSLVSQIENAKRNPSWKFTEDVEKRLGITDQSLARLLPLVLKSGPTWFREWPKIESNAHNLRTWQPLVVPGLLQTRAYARAVLRGEPSVGDATVDDATEARIARQTIFDRPEPPLYVAVIDESVLDRPIGGPSVMREQIERLIKVSDSPSITIQLVRMSSVPSVGLLGGFVIAHQSQGPDTVYLDNAADGEVTDREDRVRRVSLRFDVIRAYARPVDETMGALHRKLEEYQGE
ncbi:helix-turn-helix domain-containing protein [Nonomuraea wenchangensis]|uniref:DNA-binding transcriptional regulator, XRE-family HTH domain n=1 Tax=Nonomuraea wenchangensis TaxID=568860 RepID=A0A1I0EFT5_9ACTN|nr:helix-turn-helix transcriptional regulator [Nonomuraea wenchangensis]SET43894.1 DNA-binding transcriptional regulator, XRE-family HTH domain [Nonomuraea wenchangensis]